MIMLGLGKDGHFCGNLSGTLDQFADGCRAVSSTPNETTIITDEDALSLLK